MKKIFTAMTVLAVIAFAGVAFATSYDYADATDYANSGVYAKDATWNRLGVSWSGEASAAVVADNKDLDDGVLWSTDGGSTWGNDAITVGDKVSFQFTLYKVEYGRHSYDYLKAWIDWNNDKDFMDVGEVLFTNAFPNDPHTEADHSSAQFLDSTNYLPVFAGTYVYVTSFDTVGDYWLRARVVCNADVDSSLDNLSPTDGYYQGEIEDWKLTVNRTSVPEPATMLLLSFGLIGLARFRRKFKG